MSIERFRRRVANARKLEQAARSSGGNLREQRLDLDYEQAADERNLRGIPAIGRGVAGVIRGTDPEREATR